ncbi:Carbohydrate-selective porin, OprB family [Symmachiella dynata]|uniref:Carbohydrate-selective porin, OprB family n=1 Tax=Symmachiella dynata TaxID=2527995 RepID=A0A517ZXV2_9PLAN|nr:Carbohydrate-selective porin, OprB family [Symmachiella dynata]
MRSRSSFVPPGPRWIGVTILKLSAKLFGFSVVCLAISFCGTARAQEYCAPACDTAQPSWMCDSNTDPCTDWLSSPFMLGDLGGLRSGLAESGIVYNASLTNFYQGVTSGGNQQTFNNGGKLDQFVIFEGGKLGLNEGFMAILHAETRYGEDVIMDAAPLAPVNGNLLYPSLNNETAITGLLFQQALSEEWALSFGKFNALDLWNMLYPQTGRGVTGFMNASMILPLTMARTFPLSTLGGGVLRMKEKQIQGALVAYDSNNSTTTSGFDELFDNGAVVLGLWRFFTEFNELPGSHLFGGTWASGDFSSLDRLDWAFIPGQGITAGQQSGSWSLFYVAEQKLMVDPCNPKRNVGLLSQWGLADEETSPYRWTGNVALQAQGMIRGRDNDTLGVGYFYSGLSGQFKSLQRQFDVDNLQGGEIYYNATITPWFHLTADLQVVEPSVQFNDTAVVFGLRAQLLL